MKGIEYKNLIIESYNKTHSAKKTADSISRKTGESISNRQILKILKDEGIKLKKHKQIAFNRGIK